jgi:transposase
MRTVTRRRTQLTRQRVRIQNQLESLLEETRIKLSSVVTDLLGSSGLRILTALARAKPIRRNWPRWGMPDSSAGPRNWPML